MAALGIVLILCGFFSASSSQITRLPQCNKYSATFKVKKLKLKQWNPTGKLESFMNVENKERCSTLCIENSQCKSAIYKWKLGKKCVLYDRNIDESEMEKSRTVYYMTTDDRSDDLLVSDLLPR